MKRFDPDIIEKKIALIRGYLDDLRQVEGLSIEEYKSDIFRKRGIEKTLINIIQAAVDINSYLLVKLAKTAPKDNYDSFVELGEQGMVPMEFASRIAPSSGLRSRLVHEYDRVDDAIVHASVKDALEQYPLYIEQILVFLKKQGDTPRI